MDAIFGSLKGATTVLGLFLENEETHNREYYDTNSQKTLKTS